MLRTISTAVAATLFVLAGFAGMNELGHDAFLWFGLAMGALSFSLGIPHGFTPSPSR
jgi:hypothetical protein